MKVRQYLVETGDYNYSLDGLIGEVYVQKQLGMIPSHVGAPGIDGHINGRSVQVKTKGGLTNYLDSQHYIEINPKHIGLIDDILMVFIRDGNISHVGPVELSQCEQKAQSNGKLRIYLNEMKKVHNP
jgi:hypothetical protein